MTTRDQDKFKSKLEKSSQKYLEDALFYEQRLNSGNISENKKDTLAGWAFSSYLRALISNYSLGQPIHNIKISFIELTNKLDLLSQSLRSKDKLTLEAYNEILWTASLAVLLDTSEETFSHIEAKFDLADKPDRLVDLLLSYKLASKNLHPDSFYSHTKSEEMADRYRPLFTMFDSKSKAEIKDTLVHYLKHWYKRQQLCAWYGNHTNDNYFGYWSFESAALVKILELEEADFIRMKNFPHNFNQNV